MGKSPKTVLPSHRRCVKPENRNPRGKPTCGDGRTGLEKDFRCGSFSPHRDSCKSITSIFADLDGEHEHVHKRGSIYKSSKELRKMNEFRAHGNRRKYKKSGSVDPLFPYRNFEPLDSVDEESEDMEHKRFPERKLPKDQCTEEFLELPYHSSSPPCSEVLEHKRFPEREPHTDRCTKEFLELPFRSSSPPCSDSVPGVSSDRFIEIVLDRRDSVEILDADSIQNLKFRSHQVSGPPNYGNDILENELVLQKPLSSILQMSCSPIRSNNSDHSGKDSRARFSPIRKMFDPFMKSRSQRVSLSSLNELGEVTPGRSRLRILQKSLSDDFSNLTQRDTESSSLPAKAGYHMQSPAHLHGHLKLKHKHGVPFFEFSLKCPEEAFVARTWKADNTFNWFYTFHSVSDRNNSNASVWGLRDRNRDSPIVGQMQVSCYLCSDIKDEGALETSLVMEFVLYDTVHARKGSDVKESPNCTPARSKHTPGSKEGGPNHADNNSSTCYPWAPVDLHPHLETAAIVIEVPFEKRESTKHKNSDEITDSLLDLPVVEETRKGLRNKSISSSKVTVVTPTGNHGLPCGEDRGPSPLLDRWRSGGGCDCGGWDMGCPLVVFGSPSAENHTLVENQKTLQLFLQGAKDRIPSLTIKPIEDGQYAVEFHAQLSTLQAFSICVAMLQGAEVSATVGRERNQVAALPTNPPLKTLFEQEVKSFATAIQQREKRNITETKHKISPSFLIMPPFSPIARV